MTKCIFPLAENSARGALNAVKLRDNSEFWIRQPTRPTNDLLSNARLASLTERMETRCFGRFLIDIPARMMLSPGGGQEIDGVTLSIVPMSVDAFANSLQAKQAEFDGKYLPGKERFPYLRSAMRLEGATNGILFDRAQSDVAASRMGRVLEVLALRGGYSISASIEAVDTGFPEFANDAWIKESRTTTAEHRTLLLDVLRRTRGRSDNEVPPEKGACILNGFVSGPSSAAERVTTVYRLRDAPDIFFTLRTDDIHMHSDTLIDRSVKLQSSLQEAHGSILRIGKRTSSGVSGGEELFYKIFGDPNSERKQIMTYKFVFEANSRFGSAVGSRISIDLDNGELDALADLADEESAGPPPLKASLTEAEAVALWDAVIPTVRLRPGSF